MSPIKIVKRAAELGFHMLGLCDHNTALNCPAFAEVCSERGIVPIFGIEAATREEVHLLCLFEGLETALDVGEFIYSHLPDIKYDPERFGDQIYVDADEEIKGFLDKFLINASDVRLEELADIVIAKGGLAIPAHVGRQVSSIYSQLGFLPDFPFSALEVHKEKQELDTRSLPMVCGSDAHYLNDIGLRYSVFDAEEPSFNAFKNALIGKRIRCVFG